jgi:hypothetical protein
VVALLDGERPLAHLGLVPPVAGHQENVLLFLKINLQFWEGSSIIAAEIQLSVKIFKKVHTFIWSIAIMVTTAKFIIIILYNKLFTL